MALRSRREIIIFRTLCAHIPLRDIHFIQVCFRPSFTVAAATNQELGSVCCTCGEGAGIQINYREAERRGEIIKRHDAPIFSWTSNCSGAPYYDKEALFYFFTWLVVRETARCIKNIPERKRGKLLVEKTSNPYANNQQNRSTDIC